MFKMLFFFFMSMQCVMASDQSGQEMKWPPLEEEELSPLNSPRQEPANHTVILQPIQTIKNFGDLKERYPFAFQESVQPHPKTFFFLDGDETAYITYIIKEDGTILNWLGCPDSTRTYLLSYCIALNQVFQERKEFFQAHAHKEFLDAKTCEQILCSIHKYNLKHTKSLHILDETLEGILQSINVLPEHKVLISGKPSTQGKNDLLQGIGITNYRQASSSDKASSLAKNVSDCLKRLAERNDPATPITIFLIDNSHDHVLTGFSKHITNTLNTLIPHRLQTGPITVHPIELTYFAHKLSTHMEELKQEIIHHFTSVMTP